jgi:ABC-type multidrug transport system fused ATPase/permease subunit
LTGGLFRPSLLVFPQRVEEVTTQSGVSTKAHGQQSGAPGAATRQSARLPQQEAPPTSNRQLLRWMFAFLRPVRLLVALACVYLALSIGAEVLTTRQMGEAANHIKDLHLSHSTDRGFRAWFGGGQPEAVQLRRVIFWLGVIVLTLACLRYLREVANMKLSMTLVFYIREAVYDKLQRVGFGFHDAISTGQLINRALTDLQHVRTFIQTAVLTSLDIALVVGGYMILLLTRSPWLAALSLVPLPFWTLYIVRFGKKVQPASRAVMEAEDRSISVITENIAGVHVVKAFATEKQEIAKYSRACEVYFARVMARIRMYVDFTPVIRAIGSASHLSLFLLVAVLMIKGKLNVGDFLILGSAMGTILGRLQQVSVISDQYQNAIVSARRLHEVLAARPTVPEKPDARPLPPGPGAMRFEHVTFGYNPQKPVLHDVSFEVKGGSVVAIVGPTGSGKTTLVNLIARFYDPQNGRIVIDGADIRDVRLDSLRPDVAFVFQETYLFSASVADNIAYGRPHVSDGEVEAAARLAQAHEFVEQLPKGYDTMLGERGASLSGGQRQRLAIARAIVQDPRILVLDDATAAVDPQTDDLIHRAMRFVMLDRTTFLIAHRISTVKRADVVIVLENGRITQIGTHEQLMEQNGHYRQIAAVQLYGDESAFDAEGDRPSHMDRMRDTRKLEAVAAAGKEKDEPDEEV